MDPGSQLHQPKTLNDYFEYCFPGHKFETRDSASPVGDRTYLIIDKKETYIWWYSSFPVDKVIINGVDIGININKAQKDLALQIRKDIIKYLQKSI
jgi:hypothetical protein